MKARNFLIFIGVIFMIIFACEDVIQLNCEDLQEICDGDSLNTPPCDTCDSIYVPPVDSIPEPPDDSIPVPPFDSTDYPDLGENCVSYEGLWICGIDDPDEFDYDLLPGSWRLIRQTTHPSSGGQIDEFFGDSTFFSLILTTNYYYTEVLEGEIISEGTWEIYPELNNQLYLQNSQDEIFKYYIIGIGGDEEVTNMEIVRLDYDLPAIIVRVYER